MANSGKGEQRVQRSKHAKIDTLHKKMHEKVQPRLLFRGEAQKTLFIRVKRDALVRGAPASLRMNCGHSL